MIKGRIFLIPLLRLRAHLVFNVFGIVTILYDERLDARDVGKMHYYKDGNGNWYYDDRDKPLNSWYYDHVIVPKILAR